MSKPRLPFVYIAAPLSKGDQLANVSRAMATWDILAAEGWCLPICPHWSAFQHIHSQRPYESWLEYDLAMIERCVDAVYRLPGESPGADREAARAKELGLPVFTDYDALSTWCQKTWPKKAELRSFWIGGFDGTQVAVPVASPPPPAREKTIAERKGKKPPFPFVIGLRGLIGSGKTTTAENLVYLLNAAGIAAIRLPFAASLKDGLASMGITKDGTPDLYRRTAQALGTDLVRKTNPDHWTTRWCRAHADKRAEGFNVFVVDDVRFANEAALCDSLWFLHDDGFKLPDAAFAYHASEWFNMTMHKTLPCAEKARKKGLTETPFAFTDRGSYPPEAIQNSRTRVLYVPWGNCNLAAAKIAWELGFISRIPPVGSPLLGCSAASVKDLPMMLRARGAEW